VERSRFDEILLNNAAAHGVDVRQECAVTDVITESERVVGVKYLDNGEEREAYGRYIIDASGNSGRLHRQAGGNRVFSEFFQNVALFGYWENAARLPAPNSGNILCVAFKDGWFWYIPLSDTLTSVGAVVSRESSALLRGDRAEAMDRLIASCPLIRENLANAHRVTEGQYGQIRTRKDWSYCGTKFFGNGVVLVGDAACFVDPVFSSGVHLATYGATLAARSINSCLGGEMSESESFDEFEARYRHEYTLFHEFLIGFYDMHQSEDSYFWRARKVAESSSSELESFVNLVGGVAGVEFGGNLAGTSAEIARTLCPATGPEDADSSTVYASGGFMGRLLTAGAQLQIGAAVGDHSVMDEKRGLTVISDGLAWAGNQS
jgi:halogenation protein CepH